MKLFENEPNLNVLPFDGNVKYFGKVLNEVQSQYYFDCLKNSIDWKNDEAILFGKHFITKRMAAWYGDNNYTYTYSNTTKTALPWTSELIELKELVEQISGSIYNSCLLNLYNNGSEGMAWHSDDEKSMVKNNSIASLSLGVERKFSFKHKITNETLSLMLENVSLLLMKDNTQTNWFHSLPKALKVKNPRINLTFRTIIEKGI